MTSRRQAKRVERRLRKFAKATKSADLEDENPDGYESGGTEELDEEDPIWKGLVKSRSLNYGTFFWISVVQDTATKRFPSSSSLDCSMAGCFELTGLMTHGLIVMGLQF